MGGDPFGRAIRDWYHDEQTEPLIDRDGQETREHAIEEWYFGDHDPAAWRDDWLSGPLLDIGAGAGRDALFYQDHFETVAIDISQHLVEVMRDRGVDKARRVSMFELPGQFERDRFAAAHAIGTQVGLVGSAAGMRAFLKDLAIITTPEATAVLDNYDPDRSTEVFGVRQDPRPGVARRLFHHIYEDTVSETLLFWLCSVDRLDEATIGTPWSITAVRTHGPQYRVALRKRDAGNSQ